MRNQLTVQQMPTFGPSSAFICAFNSFMLQKASDRPAQGVLAPLAVQPMLRLLRPLPQTSIDPTLVVGEGGFDGTTTPFGSDGLVGTDGCPPLDGDEHPYQLLI